MWTLVLICCFVLLSGADAVVRQVGLYTAQALSLNEELVLDTPTTVQVSDSIVSQVTINGTVQGAAVTFRRVRIANLTIIAIVNSSVISLEDCVLGTDFIDHPAVAAEYVYVSPTTALLFASPVFSSTIRVIGGTVRASQRGVHFATIVRQSTVQVTGCNIDVRCLDRVAPSSNASARCSSVFGVSSDFRFEGRSVVNLSDTTVVVASDLGRAEGVYFVELLSEASLFVHSSQLHATANCTSVVGATVRASGVRIVTVESGSQLAVEGSSVAAVSTGDCSASGVGVGILFAGSSVVVSTSAVEVTANISTGSAVAAAVHLWQLPLGSTVRLSDNTRLSCNGTTACSVVRSEQMDASLLRVDRTLNLSSTQDCVTIGTSGGQQRKSLVLFDGNTMACRAFVSVPPGRWGPFVAPDSQLVGRCNTVFGTALLPSTLPALIPPFMETVPVCSQCHRALDCVPEATSRVSGIVGSCVCECSAAFLRGVHANRRAIGGDCAYVSITPSPSESFTSTESDSLLPTPSLSATRSLPPSKTRTPSASISTTESDDVLPTNSSTVSPSRPITKTPTVSVSEPYVATARELLRESIASRVPDLLVWAAVVASALASLYSPTLSNKPATVVFLLTNVDCELHSGRQDPVRFLDAFDVGDGLASRLTGAAVIGSVVVGLSLTLTHLAHALSPSGGAPLGRRLFGHFFAFCLTLLAPLVASYSTTTVSHVSGTRFIAFALFLIVGGCAFFAMYHVAINFPRRRSRDKTLKLREKRAKAKAEREELRREARRGKGVLHLPSRSNSSTDDDDHDGSDDGSDKDARTDLEEEESVSSDVEQDLAETKAAEAQWKEEEADDKAARNGVGAIGKPKADLPAERRLRRKRRRQKRQRHWSVWHSLRFTPTLYAFFFEARDYRPWMVRLYFFEDLIVACLVGVVSGMLPGEDRCGPVTLVNLALCLGHLAYQLALRPFRHPISTGFAMLIAAGMTALAATAYFATVNTRLIDLAVQVAVVLVGVVVVNVVVVGLAATYRFLKRQRASDERVGSDEDSEELEAQKRLLDEQRAAVEALLRGQQDDDRNPLLRQERKTAAMQEVTAATPLFTGEEERFGRRLGDELPPPPEDWQDGDETDGEIGDESPEDRKRRLRRRYPHYVERPLASHDDMAARFRKGLAMRSPPRRKPTMPDTDSDSNDSDHVKAKTRGDPMAPKTVVGANLGVLGTESRARPAVWVPPPPMVSPLLLLDKAAAKRPSAARPRAVDTADFEVLDAAARDDEDARRSKKAAAAAAAGKKGRVSRLLGGKKEAKKGGRVPTYDLSDDSDDSAGHTAVPIDPITGKRMGESKPSISSMFHAPQPTMKDGKIFGKKTSDTKNATRSAETAPPKKTYSPTRASRYTPTSSRPANQLLDPEL